jgi:hypothetical protein
VASPDILTLRPKNESVLHEQVSANIAGPFILILFSPSKFPDTVMDSLACKVDDKYVSFATHERPSTHKSLRTCPSSLITIDEPSTSFSIEILAPICTASFTDKIVPRKVLPVIVKSDPSRFLPNTDMLELQYPADVIDRVPATYALFPTDTSRPAWALSYTDKDP